MLKLLRLLTPLILSISVCFLLLPLQFWNSLSSETKIYGENVLDTWSEPICSHWNHWLCNSSLQHFCTVKLSLSTISVSRKKQTRWAKFQMSRRPPDQQTSKQNWRVESYFLKNIELFQWKPTYENQFHLQVSYIGSLHCYF